MGSNPTHVEFTFLPGVLLGASSFIPQSKGKLVSQHCTLPVCLAMDPHAISDKWLGRDNNNRITGISAGWLAAPLMTDLILFPSGSLLKPLGSRVHSRGQGHE